MINWINSLLRKNKNDTSLPQGKVGKLWLIGTPEFGNLGDHMISEMENFFIKEMFPEQQFTEITMTDYYNKVEFLEKNIKHDDIIFLHGGGNVGNLWPKSEYIRRDVFKRWVDNKKVVMPQSIYFTPDQEGNEELKRSQASYNSENILLVCREKSSFDFAQENFSCKSILTPDMVMYSKGFVEKESKSTRKGCVICFRNDKEKALTRADEEQVKVYAARMFDPISERDTVTESIKRHDQKAALDEYLKYLSSAELTITDRLHGMIFSAITGTPCVVFGNSYHKVVDSYQWIKDLKYIELADSISELDEKAREVTKYSGQEYPYKLMRSKFEEIRQYCKV